MSIVALLAVLLQACNGSSASPTSIPAPTVMPAPTVVATTAVPPTATGPRAATSLALTPPSAAVPAFGRAELVIETDGVFANPYDPAEADLWVHFTSPTGDVVQVPAFWYQPFDAATLEPTGTPGWRVRFTPTVPGTWQARATLANPQLQSEPVSFTVDPAHDAHGFVRIDQQNPRYFAFDDGAPFFGIGANIGWPTSLDATIPDYQRWFGKLGENGGNLARLWMASWGFGVEWNDTGLGDYAKRQKQAFLLDQVFEIARERDIYIMLSLLNHGAFNRTTNPEWDGNPYNVDNGGMLRDPAAFVTDEQARELFKRRLRYIAARWGYSPNLFAWEWWNEVNWTPIDDKRLKPWITEMTAELKRYDPYDHLVSNSYSGGSERDIWQMPELDFSQQHDYSGSDPVRTFQSEMQGLAGYAPKKPALMAEHGYSASGADATGGSEQIHFHNGIWAAPFTGYAGTAMSWWWDTFIDPTNAWGQYHSFAEFMRGENLAEYKLKRGSAGADINALALIKPDQALMWIRNRAYDAAEASKAYQAAGQPGVSWVYEPQMLTGRTLKIDGLSDGSYTARWFSPQTGEWLDETTATVAGGALALPLPDFNRDLALKLEAAR